MKSQVMRLYDYCWVSRVCELSMIRLAHKNATWNHEYFSVWWFLLSNLLGKQAIYIWSLNSNFWSQKHILEPGSKLKKKKKYDMHANKIQPGYKLKYEDRTCIKSLVLVRRFLWWILYSLLNSYVRVAYFCCILSGR